MIKFNIIKILESFNNEMDENENYYDFGVEVSINEDETINIEIGENDYYEEDGKCGIWMNIEHCNNNVKIGTTHTLYYDYIGYTELIDLGDGDYDQNLVVLERIKLEKIIIKSIVNYEINLKY